MLDDCAWTASYELRVRAAFDYLQQYANASRGANGWFAIDFIENAEQPWRHARLIMAQPALLEGLLAVEAGQPEFMVPCLAKLLQVIIFHLLPSPIVVGILRRSVGWEIHIHYCYRVVFVVLQRRFAPPFDDESSWRAAAAEREVVAVDGGHRKNQNTTQNW
jgi:hypothetical protein